GGSLSCADIVTALYFHILRHDPKDHKWSERDRFVLSKGHSCPALYAALAESGYFAIDELFTLRKLGSRLQGHPSVLKLPYLEASTGSLGQGLSMAIGMALAAKIDKKDYKVYALIGDGESNEGNIWEAALFAAHHKLDNLIVFLDRNRIQLDDFTEKILSLEPLADKWKAFGWEVKEIDGHNFEEIINAVDWAKQVKSKPVMIIAHTIKGKGVSFMENTAEFHGKAPNKEQYEQAMKELEK
ncbi:MAG: transketolase, partial [Candidatus Thermoplasmatota archaeon]|nr:transketolase [Candidatus Thermoplasmatota archaeon]